MAVHTALVSYRTSFWAPLITAAVRGMVVMMLDQHTRIHTQPAETEKHTVGCVVLQLHFVSSLHQQH